MSSAGAIGVREPGPVKGTVSAVTQGHQPILPPACDIDYPQPNTTSAGLNQTSLARKADTHGTDTGLGLTRKTARQACLRPGHTRAKLAAMTSNTDSNPEDEYADDEYADYDAEDREQPSAPTEIPGGEPEADVLEQRQEVPYGDDNR